MRDTGKGEATAIEAIRSGDEPAEEGELLCDTE